MRVDYDCVGWIDPIAVPNHDPRVQHKDLLFVERMEDGMKVDFSLGDYLWARTAKPEPKDGFEWIRVVEFIERPDAPK